MKETATGPFTMAIHTKFTHTAQMTPVADLNQLPAWGELRRKPLPMENIENNNSLIVPIKQWVKGEPRLLCLRFQKRFMQFARLL
eukprot:6689528-Ditylum_brightwellii.AAC.1